MTQLRRELGVPSAILLGLGSIVGTGVFVSIGIAAGITGPSVVTAVAVAGVVAAANGLSSAQLAAAHPVSGGTYEYANRLLSAGWGFAAGWMFLAAKTASAATAALGFAGYALVAVNGADRAVVPVAVAAVLVIGGVVLAGIRRSAIVNIAIVTITLLALGLFVAFGASHLEGDRLAEAGRLNGGARGWLEATALMFVAYTGYGRIATLGEEVRRPEHTIPVAIIATMATTIVLYVAVAFVGIGTVGADTLAAATAGPAAPLATVALDFGAPTLARVVEIGAVTAMLGVLLNLMLGLSRVVLAMGRRSDLPKSLSRIDAAGVTPRPAVVSVVVVIAGLTLIGDVRATWTFSAMTVLIYYAITNLAALRLAPEHRRFPRWIAVAGLVACLSLAVFVDWRAWLAAVAILGVGWVIRLWARGSPGAS